ncbi:MAG: putative Diguanylate kinase, partial [Ilumatobacteraceae bacterium]|nr:putative Diguanylate kinase [Ilumatobacteraceae bacterium]
MGAEAEAGTHRLLQRQLRKSGITTAAPTEAQWRELLVRIDRAYRQADLIASTTGHTLAVSSEEMRGRLDDVQQQSDERVLAEQDRFKLVFGSVPSGLLTFDRGGRIVSVNVQAQRVLGPQHDLIDRHLDEVLVVDDGDGTAHPLITRSDLEDELAQGRFERHDVLLRTHPLGLDDALIDDAHIDDQAIVAQTVTADIVVVPFGVDDAELGGLVMITDNAERERARGWLAWQAAHDPLTGLANRTFVEGRIDTALAQARGTGAWPSVLFLNLDRFKVVNDLLGHAFGDRLLVAAAERLERCVRGSDTV